MTSSDMDEKDSSGLAQALRVAERGTAKSDLREVLECAEKEISSAACLKSVWQDHAAEFRIKDDKTFRAVSDRAQSRRVCVDRPPEGHVVGHALVRAVEVGCLQVVVSLRARLQEQKYSVLLTRYLSFAMLKSTEAGKYKIVQELLQEISSPMVALMGYELSKLGNDSGYPFDLNACLTTCWIRSVAKTKNLLPPAIHAMEAERLEVEGAVHSDEEAVHRATRYCYQTYCIWRFLIIAVSSGHGDVVQELLIKRDECRKGMTADQLLQVVKLRAVRDQIDGRFFQLAMKIAGKLKRDNILYLLSNSVEMMTPGLSVEESCASRSRLGVWEVFAAVPVLLMELEASYQRTKPRLRPFHYIKPIIAQVMRLNIQLNVKIDNQPNYIEMTIGINHVQVTVDNQMWKEKRMGHFPTFVSLAVTPVTRTMASVSMTASSSNMAVEVCVAEHVQVSVGAGTWKATAGIQLEKSTMSEIKCKPWWMEQLPANGERGGRFNWTLSNLHGQRFDRRNPMLRKTKKSIWQFGKRLPVNPLQVLPFGSNGGVHFTGSEFDDTLSWRFPKALENFSTLFNIEGVVHTTCITQHTFWETRMVPFETQVEQKLEQCGDATGADKKKMKK